MAMVVCGCNTKIYSQLALRLRDTTRRMALCEPGLALALWGQFTLRLARRTLLLVPRKVFRNWNLLAHPAAALESREAAARDT